MIKYTIDLDNPLKYYKWEEVDSIMYDLRVYRIQTEILDDHLLAIF